MPIATLTTASHLPATILHHQLKHLGMGSANLWIFKGLQDSLLTIASRNVTHWLDTSAINVGGWVTCMSQMDQGDTQGVGQLKCPAFTPPSSLARGRLFRHASIWVSRFKNSSKVSLILVVMHRKCLFRLLAAASHKQPKWGACSGMNFHVILWDEQKWEISVFLFWSSRVQPPPSIHGRF